MIFVTTQLSARIHHISQILYNSQNSTSYGEGYGEGYGEDEATRGDGRGGCGFDSHMLEMVMNEFMNVMIRGMYSNRRMWWQFRRKW